LKSSVICFIRNVRSVVSAIYTMVKKVLQKAWKLE